MQGARRWMCLLACLFSLQLSEARAQSPDDERARVHFVAGNAYFEAGQWDEAAREFEQAHQLSGRPEMLINLSRAHERGGQLQKAIDDLTLLITRYPLTAYKPEAEQRIANMRALLGEVTPSEPDPPPAPTAQGDVGEPEPVPVRDNPRFWPPRWPTLLVGAAALAAGAGALATGVVAHGRYGDLEDKCPEGVCAPRYAEDRERGQRMARASTGLSFAALTLASATAVLWFLDLRALKTERAQLDLMVGSNDAEARLRLAF